MLPHRAVRLLVPVSILLATGLPAASVPDPLRVPCAPACTETLRAELIVAWRAAPPEDAVVAAAERAVDAALTAFAVATGERLSLSRIGSARLLNFPAAHDVASSPVSVARDAFDGGADPNATFLVVLAADLPLAPVDCACDSWLSPAGRAGPLAPAAAAPSVFGGGPGFRGVLGLATLSELPDLSRESLAFRLVHEAGHAWCCFVSPGQGGASRVTGDGHWAPGTRDPLAADAPRSVRPYSHETLVAMGFGPASL